MNESSDEWNKTKCSIPSYEYFFNESADGSVAESTVAIHDGYQDYIGRTRVRFPIRAAVLTWFLLFIKVS